MRIGDENKKRFINDFMLDIILFLIGLVLIFLSVFIANSTWSTVCISVGTSIIASVVVSVMSLKRIYKQNRIGEMIEYWGIESVYDRRAEINTETNMLLQTANKLDIIAMGLKGFRDAQSEKIKVRIEHGMKLRILTIDPNSPILNYIDKKEGNISGCTKQTIEDLIEWIKDMKKHQRYDGQIELKTYDSYPNEFYFNIDNNLYTGPYQNKTSQQTITYKFTSKGKGFEYYSQYFESLWGRND